MPRFAKGMTSASSMSETENKCAKDDPVVICRNMETEYSSWRGIDASRCLNA